MAGPLRALLLPLLCLALARSAAAAPPTITIDSPEPGSEPVPVPLTLQVAGEVTGVTDPNDVEIQVDSNPAIPALAISGGRYVATVTVTANTQHTITVTATNADDESDSASVVVIGDPLPVLTVSDPDTGFVTGDLEVRVIGTITDNELELADANDPLLAAPATLRVNGTSIEVTRDDPNSTVWSFDGKAPIQVGSHDLVFQLQDEVLNRVTEDGEIWGTRTEVCANPVGPPTDNNDPNEPHLIVVNRLDDKALVPGSFDPDANPNDICDVYPDIDRDPNDPNLPKNPLQPPFAKCTLRAALQIANAHPGPDEIRLPSNTIRLTRRGEGDDRGDLDVTEDLFVTNFASRDVAVIDARKLGDRIFDVRAGVTLSISGATLRAGQTPKQSEESGGCLRVEGELAANNVALLDCKSGGDGGGIALEHQGPDDVSRITCGIVARSSAKGDGGGIALDGGRLELRNSTVALSSAGGIGGALAVRDAELEMTNATLSTNKAKQAGGGLALADGSEAMLNNATFARNKAKLGASLSTSSGTSNTLHVSNSILGDKPKKTCDAPAGSLVSLGGNLDPGETCGLGEATDLENANPELEKLATNLGVPTHGLRGDSPAIDHGVFASCEPLDQRNQNRVDGPPDDAAPPDDDVCDSGAFEFASEAPPAPEPPKQ